MVRIDYTVIIFVVLVRYAVRAVRFVVMPAHIFMPYLTTTVGTMIEILIVAVLTIDFTVFTTVHISLMDILATLVTSNIVTVKTTDTYIPVVRVQIYCFIVKDILVTVLTHYIVVTQTVRAYTIAVRHFYYVVVTYILATVVAYCKVFLYTLVTVNFTVDFRIVIVCDFLATEITD
jgi:hypothetical protein